MLGVVALIVISVGCASGTRTVRVAVPPRVDLRAYQTVGLVNFSSNAKGQLDRLSTDKFLQAVQSAQPGTRVVELGAEAQLLASVKRNSFDAAALRAIREAHGVDVLVIGRLDVKKAKQDVQLSTVFKQIAVSSDVDANLTARLIETASGATMWTNAAQCRTNLGHANFNNRGEGTFGASDPEAAYGAMVDGLVVRITDDFRTHYVLRRVRNDDIAVANAGE